jgi:hypothetical protein
MEPSSSIDAIILAARETFKDPEARLAHREHLLERAIETLLACDAALTEQERHIDRTEGINQNLHDRLIQQVTELAVLRRRLDVSAQVNVSTTYEFRYAANAADGKNSTAKRSHKKKT